MAALRLGPGSSYRAPRREGMAIGGGWPGRRGGPTLTKASRAASAPGAGRIERERLGPGADAARLADQPERTTPMPTLTVEGAGSFDVPAGKRLVLALEDEAKVDQLHACG